MNCMEMLEQFVEDRKIDKTRLCLVEKRVLEFIQTNADKANDIYDENVLAAVIIDSFKLNAENLKKLSDVAIKSGLQIGRRHKKILLRYLNYRKESDIQKFYKEMLIENAVGNFSVLQKQISEIIPISKEVAFQNFLEMWNQAEKEKDEKKQSNYLFGLYSKLHDYYNQTHMTKKDLFEYNCEFIGKDLSQKSIDELKEWCVKESEKDSFYDKYISLLHKELKEQSLEHKLEFPMNQDYEEANIKNYSVIRDRGGDLHYLDTEEYDAVYFRLNQGVFDFFENKNVFYNYVLDALQQSYRILVNNKVLAVEIDNIYDGNRNIKWLLYAYIGVYAERFIRSQENRKYYFPEKICFEMFKAYGITFEKENQDNLEELVKKYYKGDKGQAKEIYNLTNSNMEFEDFSRYLEEWRYVYYGFTYNDCYVIRNQKDTHQQYMTDVENDNKLLYVFYKYRMDERKIPCPVCNGLKVSGNSYPEIGHRSWECKNVICRSRSKSNRGKRYSFKTNYMQFGSENIDRENTISKEMIATWRRDIAFVNSDEEIYSMFLKYFSFPEETLLFINCTHEQLCKLNKEGRTIQEISLFSEEKQYCIQGKQVFIDNQLFDRYFLNGGYVSRFIREKNKVIDNLASVSKTSNQATTTIYHGDAYKILQKIDAKSVSAAVTSPPYFNAREYSQWDNMYLYLRDMYNIAKEVKRVLADCGTYLYNIGDINGNEMTIAKSNMGIKRLLLGAYSILLFEAAGFELVDNYIWNKGEPQSKRSTNDGNFTPHYQKPVNCYEHMFLFKKRGQEIDINEECVPENWKNFVVDFMPVYKINSKGENTLGHTAPFPEDIPDFVSKSFGKAEKNILDPFLGSGTSIIAAVKNGYQGLGIELSEEYVKLAEKRFREEVKEDICIIR